MVDFFGLLPFGFSIWYHQPIIIEVNTTSFIREIPVEISMPKGKRLKFWIPRVRDKYIVLCNKIWRSYIILENIHEVFKSGEALLTLETKENIEKIYRLK